VHISRQAEQIVARGCLSRLPSYNHHHEEIAGIGEYQLPIVQSIEGAISRLPWKSCLIGGRCQVWWVVMVCGLH